MKQFSYLMKSGIYEVTVTFQEKPSRGELKKKPRNGENLTTARLPRSRFIVTLVLGTMLQLLSR